VYQAVPPKQDGAGPLAEDSGSTKFFKAELRLEIPIPPTQLGTSGVNQPVDTPITTNTMNITPKCWTGLDVKLDLILPNWFVLQKFLARV
jgi:hypothetical protein